MYTTEIIADLKRKELIFQEELNFHSIEHCSYIVEVGALTVNTDELGNVLLVNTAQPVQFSLQAANAISNMNFISEGGSKVNEKIYSRNDWHRERIIAIKQVINLVEQNY
jgi:hypothetical protein